MSSARISPYRLVSLSACLVGLLSLGCSRQYFHESQSGDRYYQTASGDILRVNRNGYVLKGTESIGTVQKGAGGDWDLHGYQVVQPSGHCLSVLNDEVSPTPCYALVWEYPLVILASPFRAIHEAFQEGTLNTAGMRTSELPASTEPQQEQK